MSIIEILEEHHACLDQTAVFQECVCGWGTEDDDHDEHLAEVLEKHVAERQRDAKADALEEAARAYPTMLRDMVSRGSVAAWLSDRAAQIREPSDGR